MPLGGTLTIETRNIDRGSGTVPDEIAGRDCICLSVRDTGGGMAEEVRLAAVEPFFTTKEVGKGSGLGLSQVYGVVRQSNGALEIESRVGAGTAVHLYLPRAIAAPEQAATQPQAGEQQPRADAFWLSMTMPRCAPSRPRCCGRSATTLPRPQADRLHSMLWRAARSMT
jgi:hypothetical protein